MFYPRYMFHALAAPLLIETQEALDALPADEWADSPPAAQELAAQKACEPTDEEKAALLALVEAEVNAAVFAKGAAQLEEARQSREKFEALLASPGTVGVVTRTTQVPETGDDVAASTTIAPTPVTSVEGVELTPQERANAEMEATIAALMAGAPKA